jgi:hypothetical protein
MTEERSWGLMKALGYPNGEVVAATGLSGGLALFWRRDVMVALQSKSRSHIDVVLSCDNFHGRQLRFTGFYGEPRREMRKNSWYLMRFLRAQLDLPWLCAGDFNEVLNPSEHVGACEREAWQMEGFQDAVADCGLMDLGFVGLPYTWDNRQAGTRNVKVRLDRAFGDHRFLDMMGDVLVRVLPTVFSDHAGLLIELKGNTRAGNPHSKRKTLFRYENMWQRHEDYGGFVNQNWDPGPGGGDLLSLASSLTNMQRALKDWDRNVFGSVRSNLKRLRKELEEERSNTMYRGPTERERRLMKELAEVLAREEEMEKQRSRADWLKSGDRNTKFFQAKAKARARSNCIRALKRADGSEETTQEGLEQLATDFYQGLFTAQEILQPELICQYIPRRVTDQMAELLERAFTSEEVEAALFQMGSNKAPGADGFTAGFFQKHWSLVRQGCLGGVGLLEWW